MMNRDVGWMYDYDWPLDDAGNLFEGTTIEDMEQSAQKIFEKLESLTDDDGEDVYEEVNSKLKELEQKILEEKAKAYDKIMEFFHSIKYNNI